MGDHKDDEKELDPSVPIASLTFGAERDFFLNIRTRKKMELKMSRSSLGMECSCS